MKNFIKNYTLIIKNSFHQALNGKENLEIVTWIWGGLAYLLALFVNKLVIWNKIFAIDFILSSIMVGYFIIHIFMVKRCAPKKTPLTKEEKEKLKKDRAKRFFRKLFLQESIRKWNPAVVAIAIDLYVIIYFFEYIAIK
jgi:quinol-cytochrome oxidoreductase complex cytochrome b subunit